VGSWAPNSIVGRYQIVERIGVGGMAEVYLARVRTDPAAPRVAIKRLLPAFANEPRLAAMFAAEARLAGTLHHPNIAKVLDVGIDHDVCWFAMELVEGHDVRALLAVAATRERPIPLATAMSIMYGTTCALAYVHDPNGPHAKLNIVHRDVSPSNILVSFAGAIKLVDFGIARVETVATPRTASGNIKGKIPYMSPEQCRGRPLDGRSDLFSLGVVLYELTTNHRPFDRDSEFATLEAIVRGQFTAPSRLVKDYPVDVEEVVLRLLATRPSDRYPSAGALLVDLDRIVSAHDLDLSNAALAAHIDALLGRARLRIVPEAPQPIATLHGGMETQRAEPLPPLSAEARVPIDRIAARCETLLDRVCPGTTDARDLPAAAVATLIGQAMRHQARDQLETAVLELELALSAARPESDIDALLAAHDALFLATFTAFIGDQSRTVALSQYLEQLVGITIDQRAAYLLTRIDNTLTVAELLATCGLPRRDACRHLCQLVLRELVVLL
jgi:serine/threonine protein kinase